MSLLHNKLIICLALWLDVWRWFQARPDVAVVVKALRRALSKPLNENCRDATELFVQKALECHA